MKKLVVLIACGLLLSGCAADPNAAGGAGGLLEIIMKLVPALAGGGGAAALVPYALKLFAWLRNRTDQSQQTTDNGVRDLIEQAITNGLGFVAANKGGAAITKDDQPEVQNYVEHQIPDALRHFGMDQLQLKHKIIAEIGKRLMARAAS